MGYPRTINNLIESFKKLPGIGEKTAERMALSVLELGYKNISSVYKQSIPQNHAGRKREVVIINILTV